MGWTGGKGPGHGQEWMEEGEGDVRGFVYWKWPGSKGEIWRCGTLKEAAFGLRAWLLN